MIINELGGYLIRSDDACFANNEKALLVLFIARAEHNLIKLNDTHREKLCCFIQFSKRMAGWLLLISLICLHNQLCSIIHSIITCKKYRCLRNEMNQIDSKNAWFLLPASFTAKFRLVFVLTLENVFYVSQQKEHRFF